VLQISVANVKTRIHHARLFLRNQLAMYMAAGDVADGREMQMIAVGQAG
jgi:hypothetical protein